jgi:hypothetical protein
VPTRPRPAPRPHAPLALAPLALLAPAALLALLVRAPGALAYPGPGLAQSRSQDEGEPLGLDREGLLRSLRRERALALQESWLRADEGQREAALVHLRPGAGVGRQLGAWPSFPALADAERALRGGPGLLEEGGWEQRLADSVTLVALPGAFEARSEGRRQSMTVHVLQLFESPMPEPVDLRLIWVSPEGREHLARTEPVRPEHFARGFEMFVSSQPSAPGEWALVPVVLRGAGVHRGLPVAVDAVEGLVRRQAYLQGAGLPAPTDPRRGRVQDALGLIQRGLRLPGLTSEDALRLAEGEPSGRPSGGLVRAEPHFVEGRLEAWRLGETPAASGVFMVTSVRDRPEEMLAGAVGRAWNASATALGYELFVTGLPMVADVGQRSAMDLLGELRAARGWGEVVLIAVGEAALLSPAALAGGGSSPEHLVLLRDGPGAARPDRRLDLPVLSIEALADEAGEEELRAEGPSWRRVLRPEPRQLLELDLPAWVSAALLTARGSSGSSGPSGNDGGR